MNDTLPFDRVHYITEDQHQIILTLLIAEMESTCDEPEDGDSKSIYEAMRATIERLDPNHTILDRFPAIYPNGWPT